MMKTIFLYVLAGCLCFSVAESKTKQIPKGKQQEESQLPARGLCAHRGAMNTHPENTIASFKAAVDAGAQMIELDVWLTKDNKMVVIHDAAVDRTTNGSGKIVNLSLSEIKKLDAGSWKSPEFKGEKIPTFEEALSVIPRNIWINVHIKGEDETPVLAALLLQKKIAYTRLFSPVKLQLLKGQKK